MIVQVGGQIPLYAVHESVALVGGAIPLTTMTSFTDLHLAIS